MKWVKDFWPIISTLALLGTIAYYERVEVQLARDAAEFGVCACPPLFDLNDLQVEELE